MPSTLVSSARITCYALRHMVRYFRATGVSAADMTPVLKLHIYCQSIVAHTQQAIRSRTPQQIGDLIGALHTIGMCLGVAMIQSPSPDMLTGYITQVRRYYEHRHPWLQSVGLSSAEMESIAAFLGSKIAHEQENNPQFAAEMVALGTQTTFEALYQIADLARPFIDHFFQTLMKALFNTFRSEFSNLQFFRFCYRYESYMANDQSLPMPDFLNVETPEDAVPDEPLVPAGKEIPIANFCALPATLPESASCSVCAADIERLGTGDDGQDAVITACNHFFHLECLNRWVNQSAMRNANLCPECRHKMCEARRRLPQSVAEDMEARQRVIEIMREEDESREQRASWPEQRARALRILEEMAHLPDE